MDIPYHLFVRCGLDRTIVDMLLSSVVQPHAGDWQGKVAFSNDMLGSLISQDMDYVSQVTGLRHTHLMDEDRVHAKLGLPNCDSGRACGALYKLLCDYTDRKMGPFSYRSGQVALLALNVVLDHLQYCSSSGTSLKTGHLLPSLSKSIFIITRESGFVTVSAGNVKKLKGMVATTDSDDSFMTGLVSFRTKNPYLKTLLTGLETCKSLDLKGGSYELCLKNLGAAPPLVQTYLALLANRIRFRNVSTMKVLQSVAPLHSLPSAVLDRAVKAKVSASFAENYAGNLNRLNLVDKSGEPVIRADIARFRSVMKKSFTNYDSILAGCRSCKDRVV